MLNCPPPLARAIARSFPLAKYGAKPGSSDASDRAIFFYLPQYIIACRLVPGDHEDHHFKCHGSRRSVFTGVLGRPHLPLASSPCHGSALPSSQMRCQAHPYQMVEILSSDNRDPNLDSKSLDLPKTAYQVFLSEIQIQLFFSCPTVYIRLIKWPLRP